ncbi:tRNA (guanine(46)-N(7))-methyltransferase TrmB [Noviherbaspirillum saxi]|uniref:tRNA (guanine(46)-N(7))-methyltransferase n=1 Tax=Noviherbaspirillum saxi TaxID=2320863 RepID=A0A3A3GCD5_9BURK|nr:SAM-dependent methyltransferase [Noviherbaspirillum saxi]RJF99885.1 SAM-dependent methyltransferase [Noviherbaspirillum saxi]
MYANSRSISSAQTTIHEQLFMLVDKHARSQFQKPIMPYNKEAFDASIAAWTRAGNAPLILDAGCGVGLSSLHLATRYPDSFIIGVDQSADRLSRNTQWRGDTPDNLITVRADLVDYWRLLQTAGVQLARHYILYPNPWPKVGQLARRWHGHAVFPTLASLGGELECRSNWRIYIEEFAAALAHLSGQAVTCESYVTEAPITPFERKYIASGHSLWRCRLNLGCLNRSKFIEKVDMLGEINGKSTVY